MIVNNLIWPKLEQLRDCLCESVVAAGLTPLCNCSIMPGAAIAYDFIHNGECEDSDGMGWVRLGSVYLTRSFPLAANSIVPCDQATSAFTVDVGIIRSMPLAEDGEGLDAADFEAAADIQTSEMAVIQQAILCCYGSQNDLVMLGGYTPVGPDGGAIGGFWTATLGTLDD